MNKPTGVEFVGLFTVIIFLFTLSHYAVANLFMLTLAHPYLYISESVLKYLPILGISRYAAIVLSVTVGILVYVVGVGLIGYAFVKLPFPQKKAKTCMP